MSLDNSIFNLLVLIIRGVVTKSGLCQNGLIQSKPGVTKLFENHQNFTKSKIIKRDGVSM